MSKSQTLPGSIINVCAHSGIPGTDIPSIHTPGSQDRFPGCTITMSLDYKRNLKETCMTSRAEHPAP